MVFKALAVLSQGKSVCIEVNRKALIHPVADDYREAFVTVHEASLRVEYSSRGRWLMNTH